MGVRTGKEPAPRLLPSLLPDLAVDWLRASPDLHHRRLNGTMVHADLTGSTRLGEQLLDAGREGNEVLIDRINAAFDPIISSCLRHNGDVLKFGGDAVLVLFAGPDHVRRALQSASEMQLGLAANRRKAGQVNLMVTVGVHSGSFDFWMVGRDEKELIISGVDGTTVVETEELAEPGQVMVSPETLALLTGTDQPTVLFDLGTGHRPEPAERHYPADVGRLLPARILAELEGLELTSGEHRLVTSGFVLCQGVERLLSTGSEVELGNQIERLFRRVREVQNDYGVTFLHSDIARDGFKLLLAAGAPVTLGDEVGAMVRAICDLVACPVELTLRGSVHCGPLFAGLLGTSQRRTYSLMGDDVNLASHLLAESANRQVVITTETMEVFRPQPASARPLSPFTVKGRTQPVTAMVLEGYEPGSAPSGGPVLGDATFDLVGRDSERTALIGALQSAIDGHSSIVAIDGPVGVGKTRLLHELTVERGPSLKVAVHACDRFASSVPYMAARSLLRQVFGIEPGADRKAAGHHLDDLGRRIGADHRDLLPLLGDVVDADLATTAAANAVSADFRLVKAAEVAAAMLRRSNEPSCLMVDDRQWIDPVSAEFLTHLASAGTDGPWMLVTTGPTPERSDTHPVGDPTVRLDLKPLIDDDLRRLVVAAAEPDVLTPDQIRSICSRSAGNPLFAIQLASFRFGADLPPSVEALLNAQLDLLPTRSRTVLKAASVLGRELPISTLESFLDAEGIAADFDPQSVGDMLSLVDDRLVFTNELLREVAYNSLPYQLRRRWHRTAGDLLEQRRDSMGDISYAALAHHYELGGDRARTWRYGRLAGEEAAARYANQEAVDAYRRALNASSRLKEAGSDQRSEVAISLGDTLERTGSYDAADDAYATALRLANDPLAKALARQRRSWIRIRQGRWTAAKSLQSRLLNELAELDDDRPELRALRRTVQLDRLGQLTRSGTKSEYDDLEADVLASADADGDDRARARAHQYRLGNMANPPAPGPASLMAETAAATFTAEGDLSSYASTMNNLGVHAHVRYDWVRAVESYHRAAEGFARAGDDVKLATVNNNLGEILSDRGDLAEAGNRFDEADGVWRATDYRVGLGVLAMNQGRLATRMGEVDRALELLDRAITTLGELKADALLAEALLRRAEALIVSGCGREADRVLDRVESIGGRDAESMAPWLLLARAAVTWSAGERHEARILVDRAADRATGAYDLLHALVWSTRFGDEQEATHRARIDELSRSLDIVDLPLLRPDGERWG